MFFNIFVEILFFVKCYVDDDDVYVILILFSDFRLVV